jgi:type III restriction enzyme
MLASPPRHGAYWNTGQTQSENGGYIFAKLKHWRRFIYITEIAKKHGDNWIDNELRQFNEDANPLLFRMACKMATGTGKTVVMSMLIAWHTLNKIANPQNRLFSDAFF